MGLVVGRILVVSHAAVNIVARLDQTVCTGMTDLGTDISINGWSLVVQNFHGKGV